ncbi:Uncharacterised protein [Mycobacteroides abscessus subsp. abscessus]|nr:Uncharacterised protein [Mycobacteroides abscessus subsp. abscessus]
MQQKQKLLQPKRLKLTAKLLKRLPPKLLRKQKRQKLRSFQLQEQPLSLLRLLRLKNQLLHLQAAHLLHLSQLRLLPR